MALYAHVVDGVLQSVGELPIAARRLDTGDIVNDLAGVGANWRRACGYYDLATIAAGDVTDDPTKRAALTAALTAATTQRQGRALFVEAMEDAIDAMRGGSWDFIDNYSPFPVPGSQGNTGDQWPVPDIFGVNLNTLGVLANRIEILRTEAARTAVAKIRIANTLSVLLTVVVGLLDATPWTPPPDR
jgi:hypothetical protein